VDIICIVFVCIELIVVQYVEIKNQPLGKVEPNARLGRFPINICLYKMDHCNLDHLNLKDLKAVCKYYKIEHASRVKRVELEALIYMAEHVQALTMIHIYNNTQVTEEDATIAFDISSSSP